MDITPESYYHVFNQGNNRRLLFDSDSDDYLLFIRLIREKVADHVGIVSYCLMPNHFHLMIKTDERCEKRVKIGHIESNPVSKGIQHLLSAYTRIKNKRQNCSGSLFRQRTHARRLDCSTGCVMNPEYRQDYLLNCFLYIHRNPLKSNLVDDLSKWPFSSYMEYAGLRNGSLVNKEIALNLNIFDPKHFAAQCHDRQREIILNEAGNFEILL